MPLPNLPSRLEFMAETRPLPPASRGNVEAAFIDRTDRGFDAVEDRADAIASRRFIRVTLTRLQRTFVFLVSEDDVRALFIPLNKIVPNLQVGDWYYGPEVIGDFLDQVSTETDTPIGILYVKADAQIRWTVEGITSIAGLRETIRPVFSPEDFSPIEFQEIMDIPIVCDDD